MQRGHRLCRSDGTMMPMQALHGRLQSHITPKSVVVITMSCAAVSAGMTVYVYHGKARGVKAQQLARYSCVLTTYTSMGMEAPSRANAKQGTSLNQPIHLHDESDDDSAGMAFTTILTDIGTAGYAPVRSIHKVHWQLYSA